MIRIGVICEYDPFHNGHARQLRLVRERFGPECVIVCLMSGNYVQRGAPARLDKSVRAHAAVLGGADLVLELPLTYALSSAEGFARGVELLSALGCEVLSFGSESGAGQALMEAARLHLSPSFDPLLRRELETGCSYPAARQRALEALGVQLDLSRPNDILGLEYCKAIVSSALPMQIFPVRREGDYHAAELDPLSPSASSIRRSMAEGGDWTAAVPPEAADLYLGAAAHTMAAGERAVLYRLRTMGESDYASLPFGSEGLWRRLMREGRRQPGLEAVLATVKSKRYTHSRLRRMVMCAVLGLTAEDLAKRAPYVRILAFNEAGRSQLRDMKTRFPLCDAGQRPEDLSYYALECRAADLYPLFAAQGPFQTGEEQARRNVFV